MDLNLEQIATPIWTRKVAEQVDSLSSKVHQIPPLSMMASAGYKVATVCATNCSLGKPFIVLVGKGNNGGDAVVAAIQLTTWGFDVGLYCLSEDPKDISPQLYHQLIAWKSMGGKIHPLADFPTDTLPEKGFVLVDGLLGIGLSRPLEDGVLKTTLQKARRSNPIKVIAIDIPSGMNPDLLNQDEPFLPADITVTFGSEKAAQLLAPSCNYCGQIKCYPINFHREAIQTALADEPIRLWKVKSPQPRHNWANRLSSSSHKFDRGHVLVIGGSPGKQGAPLLSALAAHRSGAGWISLATPQPLTNPPPFLTWESFYEGGELNTSKLCRFLSERKVRCLILGPGTQEQPLSQTDLNLLSQFSAQHPLKIIFDAGAIHSFARLVDRPFDPCKTLLTPHPGEFLRSKVATSQPEQWSDVGAIRQKCKSLGVSLLYKSATPIMIAPHLENQYLCSTHRNNALAQAGSGDILAGIVAGLSLSGIDIALAGILAHQYLLESALRHTKKNLPTPLELIDNILII